MNFKKEDILNFSELLLKIAGNSRESVMTAIENAKNFNFLEVSVPSFMVKAAAEKLKGSKVKISTFIDFPSGLSSAAEKCAQINALYQAGAVIFDVCPNLMVVKDFDFKILDAELALIFSAAAKLKNAAVRILINDSFITEREKDSLVTFLKQKKFAYRVMTLNSLNGFTSACSFGGDMANKVIRVNFAERKAYFEELGTIIEGYEERETSWLYGRALCSALINSEIDPNIDACGIYNKLFIASGALSGCPGAVSDSLSIGAKSPKSEMIKVITRPSLFAAAFANIGARALILEGDGRGFCYVLKICKDRVEILSGENLSGLNTYEMAEKIKEIHGENCSYLLKSPMAEANAHIATISANDVFMSPDVQFGSGLGLVMRNFGLMAVIIDDSECEKKYDAMPSERKADFEKTVSSFSEALKKDRFTGEILPSESTLAFVMQMYEAGVLPICNFTKFESANISKLSVKTIKDIILKRKGSFGVSCAQNCPIKCKNIFADEKGQKIPYLEYEHIAALGSMSEIYNVENIAKALKFSREKGLDFNELALGIAEVIKTGIIKGTPAEIASLCLSEIEKQTILGKIMIKGVYAVTLAIGSGSPLTINNEAVPPYDLRAAMGLGVSYLTSPIGAEEKSAGYTLPVNVQKIGGFVPGNKPEGQVELSKNMQVAFYLMDMLGLCHNAIYPLLENQDLWNLLVKLITLRYNIKANFQDFARLIKKIIKYEFEFNEKTGHTMKTAKLPEIFYEEKNLKTASVFSLSSENYEKIFENHQ
ncbi:MAG: aldehyde ferredoxin oxidoreductase C-terminal domain-containing protein [Candidatus Wallbacteria bacterium]